MKLTIGNQAIILDGEGDGVAATEILRIKRAFKALFEVSPEVRLTGNFGQGAYVKTSEDAPLSKEYRLTSTGTTYRVRSIGKVSVQIDLESGLNRGRPLQIIPDNGTMVRVRFLLPTAGTECPKCGARKGHRGSCRG